jgi:hypothetical protein
MPQPAFDLVDTVDSPQIHRVNGQAVKRVGRHAHDFAAAQTRDNVLDPIRFRFIRV